MIQRTEVATNGGTGAVLTGLRSSNPSERARTARMLHRFLACSKITRDPEFWAPVIEQLQRTALESDDRDATAAAKVLAQLRAQDIDIVKHLDKNDRLDTGKPTDNVRVFVATFDKQG